MSQTEKSAHVWSVSQYSRIQKDGSVLCIIFPNAVPMVSYTDVSLDFEAPDLKYVLSCTGHYSSLSMIDSHHYRLIAKYALLFSSSKTSISIGNFEVISSVVFLLSLIIAFQCVQVTVDTAVSGFTPLYGRVSPYLLHVELKEHLYIEGPESLEDELLASFAGFGKSDLSGDSYILLISAAEFSS